MSLRSSFYDFGMRTTAHGVPRATESHGLRKVLWFSILVCCIGAFSLQAMQLVNKFLNKGIIVNVAMMYEDMSFPAVTICNLNPYKNSLARLMGSLKDTLQAFETAMDEYSREKEDNREKRESQYPSTQFTLSYTFCSDEFGYLIADDRGEEDCICLKNEYYTWFCRKDSAWQDFKCTQCETELELCKTDNLTIGFNCKCIDDFCIKDDKFGTKLSKRSIRPFKSRKRTGGLIVTYSHCNCTSIDDCKSYQSNELEDLCLCVFNTNNGFIWPCYSPDMWIERKCKHCSALDDCSYSQDDIGKIPCICTALIRMCVRIRTEEEMGISLVKPAERNTTGNDTQDEDYRMTIQHKEIPKLWDLFESYNKPLPIVEDIKAKTRKEEAYGLKGMNDPIAMKTKASENLMFAAGNLKPTEKEYISYSKEEFIMKCSFNGRACSVERDFLIHNDPSFGNCFTFRQDNSSIERAGPAYGLRVQLFVNITDYLPTTPSAGVRIAIHDKDEQPFPDSYGYSAPTGLASSLGIRQKRMDRLPFPYGNCVPDGKDENYIYKDKIYTPEGCIRSCLQKYLVNKCGCGDPRFPEFHHYRNCPVDDPVLRSCLQNAINFASRYADRLNCACKQPCREFIYEVSYSASRWPATMNALTDCPSGLNSKKCFEYFREQCALVEVFYEKLNYEILVEGEAYGFANLLADFGGQLGLWMGVSVITLIELGILILDVIAMALSNRKIEKLDQKEIS